ncbi:MAG: hypothetical protein V1806_12930 [Pseudomonadota bacterium]
MQGIPNLTEKVIVVEYCQPNIASLADIKPRNLANWKRTGAADKTLLLKLCGALDITWETLLGPLAAFIEKMAQKFEYDTVLLKSYLSSQLSKGPIGNSLIKCEPPEGLVRHTKNESINEIYSRIEGCYWVYNIHHYKPEHATKMLLIVRGKESCIINIALYADIGDPFLEREAVCRYVGLLGMMKEGLLYFQLQPQNFHEIMHIISNQLPSRGGIIQCISGIMLSTRNDVPPPVPVAVPVVLERIGQADPADSQQMKSLIGEARDAVPLTELRETRFYEFQKNLGREIFKAKVLNRVCAPPM